MIFKVLAWYLNEIWPGEYGVPKPYLFPFMKSYWYPRAGLAFMYPSSELMERNGESSSFERVDVIGALNQVILITLLFYDL